MAAISKRLLHLRRISHFFTRPYPYTHHRHFSSSDDHDDAPKPESPPSVSSSLNGVRANLQNAPPPGDRPQPPRSPFSFSGGPPFQSPPPSSGAGSDDLSQLLATFRARSAPPPSSDKNISLSEYYMKNAKSKGESSGVNFDSIRQSMSNLPRSGAANAGRKAGDLFSRSANPNSKFAGGSGGAIPQLSRVAKGQGVGVFGLTAELNDPAVLGPGLQALRPDKRKGNWFSLQELNDRIAKHRRAYMIDKQRKLGFPAAVADNVYTLTKDTNLKARIKPQQVTVGVLTSMGATGTLADKNARPKDHLCEKYFHPDHMSSAEKMKLELAKVRDEFKMSESDCGSARVQVAQLTTKIKHLSSALHKKDKHSRRGLLAMVQRRKRLLKYLRRTDWDSYCLVLDKLGLRDNFDIKAYMPKLR